MPKPDNELTWKSVVSLPLPGVPLLIALATGALSDLNTISAVVSNAVCASFIVPRDVLNRMPRLILRPTSITARAVVYAPGNARFGSLP
jgi:hypothetical protein